MAEAIPLVPTPTSISPEYTGRVTSSPSRKTRFTEHRVDEIDSEDQTASQNATRPSKVSSRYNDVRTFRQRRYASLDNDLVTTPVTELHISGWRKGVILSTLATVTCLAFEVVLLVIAESHRRSDETTTTLYHGDCDRVKNLTTGLLIPINLIGTVTIAAVNYVSQVLLAPTRREVDFTHANGQYMNVGVASLRNLYFLDKWKRFVYLSLILSTIPIHLLLNSVLFASLSTQDYGVLVVSDDWLIDSSWNQCANLTIGPKDEYGFAVSASGAAGQFVRNQVLHWACALRLDVINNATGSWRMLDRQSCMSLYANPISAKAGNVVLLTKENTTWAAISNHTGSNLRVTSTPVNSGVSKGMPKHDVFYSYKPAKGSGYFLPTEGDWSTTFGIRQLQSPLTYAETPKLVTPAQDDFYNISSVRSVWNAIDYSAWAIGQSLYWNFSSPTMTLSNKYFPSSNSWLCNVSTLLDGRRCAQNQAVPDNYNWKVTPNNISVDHCISRAEQGNCTLSFSSTIISVIIAFETVRVVMLVGVIWQLFRTTHHVDDLPLVTTGDAIASFLERQETLTTGQCLLDQELARRHDREVYPNLVSTAAVLKQTRVSDRPLSWRIERGPEIFAPLPLPWRRVHARDRWRSVPSRARWHAFACLYALIMMVSIALFVFGLRQLASNQALSEWSSGIGEVNSNAIFSNGRHFSSETSGTLFGDVGGTNLITDAALVNLPQLVFSALYFVYNGLFTCMSAAREWSKFSLEYGGRTLRVSRPRGQQRSTYWLSLPWRYSVPLIAISTLMHWLISRSIFLVRIDVYNWNHVREPDKDISACGYSPIAVLLAILVLVIMLLFVLVSGSRKVKGNIPVVGTNSRAISAACHASADLALPASYVNADWQERRRHGTSISLKKLVWGVVTPSNSTGQGHCCLTDNLSKTEPPIVGEVYA